MRTTTRHPQTFLDQQSATFEAVQVSNLFHEQEYLIPAAGDVLLDLLQLHSSKVLHGLGPLNDTELLCQAHRHAAKVRGTSKEAQHSAHIGLDRGKAK